MNRKMPRRMVALSSSAIAAIYFAGFMATRAADAGIASAAAATQAPTSFTENLAATAPSAATVAAASVTAYRDGTYSGTGTSRRGGVTVSVTVAGGRITN